MDESQCCVNILDVEHAPHSAVYRHTQPVLHMSSVYIFYLCGDVLRYLSVPGVGDEDSILTQLH